MTKGMIDKLFCSILLYETECTICGAIKYNFEDTITLSLPLPQTRNLNLKICLQGMFKEETARDFYCRDCKNKGNANRRTSLWVEPQICIIQLKKFTADKTGKKIQRKEAVTFPLKDLYLPTNQSGQTNRNNKFPI